MNERPVNTFKPEAGQAWLLAAGLLLVLGAVACSSAIRPASQSYEQGVAKRSAGPMVEVSPADAAAADDPCSEMFSNFFVDVGSVSYGGYEVVRLQKTVRDPHYNGDIPIT